MIPDWIVRFDFVVRVHSQAPTVNVAEPASRIAIPATARHHMTAAATTTRHHLRRGAAIAPTTASSYADAYPNVGG